MPYSFKFVYGPVPSRRLGESLGVSPIPNKTCNYSCVYCQLGRTTHFINERRDFYPKEDIFAEIKEAVSSTEKIDYITFVGEGEPTLYKSLGWLIAETKKLTTIPIAVITNGSLLYLPEVRKDLLKADVVLPTLDAVDQALFRKVNRPRRELVIDKIIQGMMDFRAEYSGEIWMEVMLVKGLNDSEETIQELKTVLDKLRSERVYVNVPIRPPAEKWVEIPDKEVVLRICKTLGATNLAFYESTTGFTIQSQEEIEEEILKITTRHPLREDQILHLTAMPTEKIRKLLETMVKQEKLKKMLYNEQVFYENAKRK
ncbi:MAG: radical SAM protein [Candidatus Heimdallarchaeota archaeon]|nr:radical SAM protein [Candidatus Heimdallarchaeota archaeon]